MAWSVWTQRNQVRLDQPNCMLSEIAQPPPIDLYKINYDGATYDSENKSGIGVVIRDSHGSAIASLSQQLPRLCQATEIEILVATRALEYATKIGITDAVLEGDSLLVVQAISAATQSLSPLGFLIDDATSFNSFFNELHYSRTKVAYNLAWHARNLSNYVVWIEFVPPPSLFFFSG
ncbi:uncharacterized protein LOC142628098 [Castanea sativa]|uniref:uncharacterized protein LOC142628098 n=1 Tax=Castanea sativa TaxID=21020 RepID=UPI003F651655